MMETQRHTATPAQLVRQTIGSPGAVVGKVVRLAGVVAGYANPWRLQQRLDRLQTRGHVETLPTRVQLVVGSIDLLRFWIVPTAADYYEQSGIDFRFHQLLRFLDEPASLADPLGLFSTADGIIGHLMQVVHANPVYDLQMLDLFDDGIDQLERQIEQMLNGTHPRALSIGAIVEEPEYHAQLLDFVRRWRRDPEMVPLLRSNIVANPKFVELEKTFGQLPTVMRYFTKLPRTVGGAVRHVRTVTAFPKEL